MDDAVLAAYGWQLDTTCGFALDYLDLDEEAIQQLPTELQVRIYTNDLWFPDPTEAVTFDVTVKQIAGSRRKLPWRYRWTDKTRDDILARLLDLNQQRYDDFRPDSDIDLLVDFAPRVNLGLLDFIRLENELSALLGRPIDLVEKSAVETSPNWIRRTEILNSAQVIYAA